VLFAQAVAELPKDHGRVGGAGLGLGAAAFGVAIGAIALGLAVAAAPDQRGRAGHGHQVRQQRLLQRVVALRQPCFRIQTNTTLRQRLDQANIAPVK
jgi:hypothetical protein